ncbi:MAG TPA: hypothetical protein VHZ76_08510 [Gammaproteobacteria bacterium]|jgi:hypothetical protein|nr:hypothetical protein [Gammaproteobacteria bacterium]
MSLTITHKYNKGSTFDSFLEEEGLLKDTKKVAIKRIIAYKRHKRDIGADSSPSPVVYGGGCPKGGRG